MSFGELILTNRGRNLQSKAQTGVELQYTRIGIGDGHLGTAPILSLNALRNEVISLDIMKLEARNDRAVVGTVLSNQDVTEGFYYREIGVFASDPDLGEILYCYGNAGELAEYIPPGGGPDIIEKSIDIQTVVGNAENVSAIIDESLVYATKEDLENIEYPVTSVNNKTGAVNLNASDVGAETPSGAQAKANQAETNAIAHANNELAKKVDKVTGKGLSTNDYTTTEKNKLAGIEAGANNYVLPTNIETTEGSQEKVDALAGEGNDITVKELHDQSKSHKADDVSQGELHGFRLTDGKLEYFDGLEWQRVRGDGYPVGNISNFNAKSDDKQITLAWQDPDDVTITDSNDNVITIARWKGTKVLRKTGSYPQNENDGVLVVDNGIRNQYATNGFEDTGLQNDTEYFYMAFPYTEEDVYTVDEANRVSATPTEIKIYGVEIDESNSNPETSVVYTDDAIGFTPARGNNGNFTWGSWESIIKDEFEIRPVVLQNLGNKNAEVNYALQHDDYTKKSDGSNSNLTGTDGDVMVEFGTPLWWKFTRVGDKLKIQLSTKEFDGAVKHAFEIEKGYNQVPIYPLFLTQIIYLLMFKSLDSQTALGRGYVDGNSNYLNTGVSNNRPFIYGEITGKQQMKFLGLEDYWGNRRWWIDGCFYDNNRNILIGKGNFNDTGSGYENFGQASSVDLIGYIDKVRGGNNTGFIPASTGGSTTTYYCDYGSLTGGRLPDFGGHHSDADYAGGFSLLSRTAAYAYADVGGRLFYSDGVGKIYIGTYLGVNQSSKLRSISGQTSHNNATIRAFRTLAKANN